MSFILDDRKFMIGEILDRWYDPDYDYFKVKTDDRVVYLLGHDKNRDQWIIDKLS